MRRHAPLLALLVMIVAAGCTSGGGGDAADQDRAQRGAIAVRLASSLRPFDACDDLLDHVRTEADAHAGVLGFPEVLASGGRRELALDAVAAPQADAPAAPKASSSDASAGSAAAPGFSGTNVQEAGVDEPDTVKSDGRRIFAVARGQLQALEVIDGRHRLAGSLPLPGGGSDQLLLAGDRLFVLSSGFQPVPLGQPGIQSDRMMVMPGGERTTLTLIDASDPAALRVQSKLEVDGRVVGARMVGDVVRVVTSAAPRGFEPVYPAGPSVEDQSLARQANRRQMERSTLANWIPSFRLETARSDKDRPAVTSGLLVSCERVSRPVEFSGLGTISVLTFDLSEGLGDGNATSVLADGQTVYASESDLYVATTRYADALPAPEPQPARPDVIVPPPAPPSTEIHKFDITGSGPARHVGSGRVRGHLLNQFSLSEHDGRLRVATTDEASDGRGSESLVTVLEERDGRLVTVGTVGDLGLGERIYAVRFLGAVGYVVTFRQTDPLYTIDLSDPARPLVVGELKIPGYSAYLHPVGDGLLLGVGQDATDTGRRLGTQVSLFDVSDPARPERLDQAALGSGSSTVEFDHHAFLWWGPRGLAVVPVQSYDQVPFAGAVGFSVGRERGIEEIGRLSHRGDGGASSFAPPAPALDSPIQRSLVIGETLYTVSDTGILASAAGDLSPRVWVQFP